MSRIAWNKGLHYPIKHDKQFKKGQTPWNKGTMQMEKINCKGCGLSFDNRKAKPKSYCFQECYHNHKSVWNKGIPMGLRTKLKMKETLKQNFPNGKPLNKGNFKKGQLSGKNHPNYRHGHFVNQINKTLEWARWRKSVFERDSYCCRECRSKKSITPHHILKKSDYPELIFEVMNGITLCKPCHDLTIGNEYQFVTKYNKLLEVMFPLA